MVEKILAIRLPKSLCVFLGFVIIALTGIIVGGYLIGMYSYIVLLAVFIGMRVFYISIRYNNFIGDNSHLHKKYNIKLTNEGIKKLDILKDMFEKKYNVFIKNTDEENYISGYTDFGKKNKIFISNYTFNNYEINIIKALFFHELGHIKLNHNKLSYYVKYIFLNILGLNIVNNYIQRKCELEADRYSIKLNNKNDFILLMDAVYKNNKSNGVGLFSSHPSYYQRINIK